jgi:hypothetical protein
VQFLGTGEEITPRSFSKSRETVCREKPVSSATSPTVYAGFKVMPEIILARMSEGRVPRLKPRGRKARNADYKPRLSSRPSPPNISWLRADSFAGRCNRLSIPHFCLSRTQILAINTVWVRTIRRSNS